MFRFSRLAACALLMAGSAAVAAEPPKFNEGGFLFQIQYGPGFWTMSEGHLNDLTGNADPAGVNAFVTDLPTTHTATVGMAYNILGHASIGADLTATGWRLTEGSRGGGGFVVGKVAWHPLELFFLRKERRPIPLDFNTYFGVGYGIVGAGANNGNLRGMDGLLFEWGLNVDWFFTRYFALGVFARGVFFNWDKFYQDYDNKVFIALSSPSGGSFWTFGLTITLRAGD